MIVLFIHLFLWPSGHSLVLGGSPGTHSLCPGSSELLHRSGGEYLCTLHCICPPPCSNTFYNSFGQFLGSSSPSDVTVNIVLAVVCATLTLTDGIYSPSSLRLGGCSSGLVGSSGGLWCGRGSSGMSPLCVEKCWPPSLAIMVDWLCMYTLAYTTSTTLFWCNLTYSHLLLESGDALLTSQVLSPPVLPHMTHLFHSDLTWPPSSTWSGGCTALCTAFNTCVLSSVLCWGSVGLPGQHVLSLLTSVAASTLTSTNSVSTLTSLSMPIHSTMSL